VINAELFKFDRLVFVGIDKELNHIVIVHILHKGVLTKVLEAI